MTTTPPPKEEPPVGESLWVDAEWWRAMSDTDPARADAAAALTDPLTDPLPEASEPEPSESEPEAEPEPSEPEPSEPEAEPPDSAAPEPDEPESARGLDLHVPRVLPEPAAAAPPPPVRAPRVQEPIVRPPAPGPRRRAVPTLSGHLADLLLLLLALGVVALVYVALTR